MAESITTTDGPLLETAALSKHFGELTAVDGVNLQVERGEFRSIIGPNGAGKTTLFNLITGALEPTSGTVHFDSEDITDLSPHRRVRRGLARSFQITNIFGGLTVEENVRLAAQAVEYEDLPFGKALFESVDEFTGINQRTARILERTGLEHSATEPARALSYGDQRRLELAMVLATDPKLVLLDEPTAGMSGDETATTMELIEDVLSDRTLILVEHDVDLVLNISDTVVVLEQGQVIAEGPPDVIADDEEVQRAYLGEQSRSDLNSLSN